MIASTVSAPPDTIFYPETDGQPLSENTRQFQWIVMLADNLAALYHNLPEVFVCGNQNWYPVEAARPAIGATARPGRRNTRSLAGPKATAPPTSSGRKAISP